MKIRILTFLFILCVASILSSLGLAGDIKTVGASASADYDYSQYDSKATLPDDYQDYKEYYIFGNRLDYYAPADVNLKNIQTNNTKVFITLQNLYNQHYHSYEYHKGNVYLIKRTGNYKYPSNDWTDELWKYDYQKKGVKIVSFQGLDFRVSPDEKYVIVSSGSNGEFKIINLSSKQSQDFTIPAILTSDEMKTYSYVNITLVGWSDKSDICWAALTEGPDILMYIKIIPVSWSTTKYNLLGQIKFGGDESVFNPNNGRLVYSDIPFFYAADQAKDFHENKNRVNLFVYDLNAQKNILIDKSDAKKFNPKWIDDNTIEYDNPNGEGRVRYNISQ